MGIEKDIFNNFELTMSGLEKGLQVIHITTPANQLLCCQHNEDIGTVLARSDLKPFDQIPVKKQAVIIGLLNKRACNERAGGVARDHMQPLGEEILVSVDTPLLEFIQNQCLDRIVVGGMKIYGLVTRSDLLKLPVFLLGFALVTHVERLMLNMIRATGVSETNWLMWLSKRRKGEIQAMFAKLTSERADTDRLDLTYFSDKSKILKKLSELETYRPHLPDKMLIEQLIEIKTLRNTIAHSSNSSENEDILQKFIERLRIAHDWIEHVRKR